jgi:uncharacterized protein (TIGR02186 family)
MRWPWISLGLLLMAPSATQGQTSTQLSAALIDEAILVTSSFAGAKITVFGSVRAAGPGRTDIVVAVRGPDRPAWIGERTKTAGLWISQHRIYFDAAPTFFGVASGRPLLQIAPADTLSLYGLSAKGQLDIADRSRDDPRRDALEMAYVEARQRQKLYVEDASAVKLLPGGLFRADVRMPDKTPPGLYTAKVMVFRNGRPAQSTLSTLVVSKVGLERALFEFAQDRPVLHGLAGIVIALFAGWSAARLFRRFLPI